MCCGKHGSRIQQYAKIFEDKVKNMGKNLDANFDFLSSFCVQSSDSPLVSIWYDF
jgi:hypothetical protein